MEQALNSKYAIMFTVVSEDTSVKLLSFDISGIFIIVIRVVIGIRYRRPLIEIWIVVEICLYSGSIPQWLYEWFR